MSEDGGRSSEDEHSGESGALAAAREHVHARDRDVPSERDHVSGPSQEARPLPLHSRKITVPMLRQIAAVLGVPTHAGSGDLRLLIEAAVGGAGHEPQNVQVLL